MDGGVGDDHGRAVLGRVRFDDLDSAALQFLTSARAARPSAVGVAELVVDDQRAQGEALDEY